MHPPTPSICVCRTGFSPKASITADEIMVLVAPVSQTVASTSHPDTITPFFLSKNEVITQSVWIAFTLHGCFLLIFCISTEIIKV